TPEPRSYTAWLTEPASLMPYPQAKATGGATAPVCSSRRSSPSPWEQGACPTPHSWVPTAPRSWEPPPPIPPVGGVVRQHLRVPGRTATLGQCRVQRRIGPPHR